MGKTRKEETKGTQCFVINCKNYKNKVTKSRGISFHKFPDKSKQRDLYLEWVRLCRRTVDPSNTALVCSAHFRPSMVNTTMHHAQLREGAIPELVDLPSHLQVSTRTRSTVTSTSADLPVPMPQPGPSTEQMHTEHAYPLPAEVTPDSRISELGTQVESLRRKLKNTKAREKRAKETTQSLLKELEEKNLINAELEVRLESYKDIPCDLFQKPTKEYSAAQKNFALTLHLYSSKAYRYTRETKGINLPEPRTLRRWLEKYDAQPGLNGLMMNSLAAKAKENPADYTLCSMMLDGMSIKQKMEYDAKTNKTVGFVDLGAGSVEDVEAKEALVVMLVGLKANWKCAIAYYFTKGLSSEQQTELVKHCLDACHEANLRVCSLTMDGHSTNKGMAKLLGCRLKLASSFCPSFDYNGHKIHLYFDACHMVKLVRNTLEAYSVIVGPSGRIVWQFIKDLHTTQEDIGLRLGNKLTPDHIDFKNKKMKVKLAVQVLSSSVASALEFLQSTGMYSFSNAGPTVEFIRRIDRLFDVLNSRSPYGKGTKQPIRTENWAEIKTFLLETKDYLTALKTVEGIPLHTSVRGTCIVGLCMDIVSTIAIVEELMLPKVHGFNYFLTYRTSQDHLELFFCAVRQCGGSSNNPTAGQFTSIFRRLLARTGRLLGSAEANVKRLDDTALLDGTTSTYVPPHDTNAAEITREEHNYAALHKNMGILVENIVVYIAGWVIKKAIDQLRCEDCRISLVSDTSSESSVHYQAALKFLSMKNWSSKLHVPSDGVIAILLKAEQHLRDLSSMKYVNPKISLVRLQYLVLRDVDPDVLCLHSHVMDTAQGIDNHSYDLVRLLVKIYFNVRYYHVARLHTQKFQARSVRQKLNKLVLFKGQ